MKTWMAPININIQKKLLKVNKKTIENEKQVKKLQLRKEQVQHSNNSRWKISRFEEESIQNLLDHKQEEKLQQQRLYHIKWRWHQQKMVES